jgi:hypothetical protein
MTTREIVIHRRPEFDVVLDGWPGGAQGKALHSLIETGDVAASPLPYGFVGLTIAAAQTLLYVEAGKLHLKQILLPPDQRVPRYRVARAA